MPNNASMHPTRQLRELGSKSKLRPSPTDRALARLRRPLDRAYESNALALDSLTRLGRDLATDSQSRSPIIEAGTRVLVVSLRGWSTHNAYELTIAHALHMRGAQVALLTCGGGMPACELGWARHAHPRPCDRCAWLTDKVLASAALEHYRLSEYLPWGSDARDAPARPSGRPGESARDASLVSVAWLLKATRWEQIPDGPEVARDFAVAAEGVESAAEQVFDKFEPNIVFLLNGLFGAECTIRGLALRRGVRAPTYEIAPRGGALVFSQDTPAPDYDVDRLWTAVRERPLSTSQRSQTIDLLEDRARGVGAHESYYERPEDDPDELRRLLELSGRERLVSLFTNVTWDSATIGHDIGFASMFDWIEQAVRLAAERELVLVIRIHPAEGRWGTREAVQETIVSRLGEIPANVRFISAGEALSSYALLAISDLLLTYTTTVGLEAAARGKQVAVAGETHYRGRGFTVDISSPSELAHALDRAPTELPANSVELAMRYAHMFFFRAMIPFPLIEAQDGKVRRFPQSAAALLPGADPHLDWICERILDGEEFGLPDRLAGIGPSEAAAV
jgi:hypothetical protein